MKYLLGLTLLVLAGCSRNGNDLRIGMHVTNGHCSGYLVDINYYSDMGRVTPAICETVTLSFMYEKLDKLTQVRGSSK